MTPTIEDVAGWGNLLHAAQQAARGKHGRREVAAFELRLEDELIALSDALREGRYRPGPYRSFIIHEAKRRKISAAPFRDRVIHHALIRVTEPIFERHFSPDSYASRPGRGTLAAIERFQSLACARRYVLRADVVKHFPSMDHAILRERLARWTPDPSICALVDTILDSGRGILDDERPRIWFPGDDLLAPLRPAGLPIGNLTSQVWSNCYLDSLDQYVRRTLRCPGYLRYVDDLAFFSREAGPSRTGPNEVPACRAKRGPRWCSREGGPSRTGPNEVPACRAKRGPRWCSNSKVELFEVKAALIERVAGLRLRLHVSEAQVTPVRAGVPWLGFVITPERRRVKSRKVRHFTRRCGACGTTTTRAGWRRRSSRLRSLDFWRT